LLIWKISSNPAYGTSSGRKRRDGPVQGAARHSVFIKKAAFLVAKNGVNSIKKSSVNHFSGLEEAWWLQGPVF